MNETSSEILVVPSASLVPDELRLDIGSIPTAMIPVQGKPILKHIAKEYDGIQANKVVAVGESGELVRDYVRRSHDDWTVIDVGQTTSVGETILQTLERLDRQSIRNANLYINYADTLVEPVKQIDGTNYVTYKETDRTYRWTTFEINDGSVNKITPKYRSNNGEPQPTFIGQFGLTNADQFRTVLRSIVGDSDDGLDLFYAGLLSYLQETDHTLFEPDTWLDVGHLDTFYRAKKEFLNTREFNELSVNKNNVITKRSDDTETLINEIKWYNKIPTKLQPYLPRLYDWSVNDEPYVKMEYIGYPSLSDLQLYGSHGRHIWDGVFHRLFDMMDEFQEFEANIDEGELTASLENIYLKKTRRRLDKLKNSGTLDRFLQADRIVINGQRYPSIAEIREQIEDIVYNIGLFDIEEFSIIHGDLCFPNIMYDPRNEIIKLIDPRGKFGCFRIYGDPRYDIAKLRHSVAGHYEHLINDRFDVSCDPEETVINYQIYTTDEQDLRKSHFDSLLRSRPAIDPNQVKLIEALLFLTMVPLHGDSQERQQCMFARGIEKIAPYLS